MTQQDPNQANGEGMAPQIFVKAEKNSRGNNYEASVTLFGTVDEALTLLDQAMTGLESRYGKVVP